MSVVISRILFIGIRREPTHFAKWPGGWGGVGDYLKNVCCAAPEPTSAQELSTHVKRETTNKTHNSNDLNMEALFSCWDQFVWPCLVPPTNQNRQTQAGGVAFRTNLRKTLTANGMREIGPAPEADIDCSKEALSKGALPIRNPNQTPNNV